MPSFGAGVDPRVCGVADFSCLDERLDLGRSPRMRGSLGRVTVSFLFNGSIPAYAG